MLIPKRGLYVQHTCIEKVVSSLAGWLGNAVWGVLQGDAGRRLLNRLSPFMVSSVEIRRRKFFFLLPLTNTAGRKGRRGCIGFY